MLLVLLVKNAVLLPLKVFSSKKVHSGSSYGTCQGIELKNKVLDNMLCLEWYQARAHKQISVELLQLEVSQTMKSLTTRALHAGRHRDLKYLY